MVFVLSKQTAIISSYCSVILYFTFQYLAEVDFISTFLSAAYLVNREFEFTVKPL